MKMIQEKEWNEMGNYIRWFANYEELYKETGVKDGKKKEFIKVIKNHSRIARIARVSGTMIVNGCASVELNEGQSAEDIDWCDVVCDPDDMQNCDYEFFDPDGDGKVVEYLVMNDYDTYKKEFIKDMFRKGKQFMKDMKEVS